MKPWNACYHSVQNLLSSSFLSRNIKIKIHKQYNFAVVLYGCKTWSLALREEHSLRVFENCVLRRIFGPKRVEAIGKWRKLHNEKLNNLYSPLIIIWVMKSRKRWVGHVACMGKGEVHTGFWWGNLRARDHMEDPGIDERVIQDGSSGSGMGGMDWTDLAQDRDRW